MRPAGMMAGLLGAALADAGMAGKGWTARPADPPPSKAQRRAHARRKAKRKAARKARRTNRRKRR